MTTLAEQIAIRQAFERGEAVQWRPRFWADPAWNDMTDDKFDFLNCDYRINPKQKPKPKPKVGDVLDFAGSRYWLIGLHLNGYKSLRCHDDGLKIYPIHKGGSVVVCGTIVAHYPVPDGLFECLRGIDR